MNSRWFLALFLLPALVCNAQAQQFNLLGALMKGIAASQARKGWDQTDTGIRDCLAATYHIDVNQLIQNGIGPTDTRVSGYMTNCQNIVAQQQARADQERRAEEERQKTAAAAEESREQAATAAEESRKQAAATAEESRKQEAAEQQRQEKLAAVAEKAANEKRHAALTAKYGAKTGELIFAHNISLGMTKDQVIDAKGQPTSRQIVPPSDEMWKYGGDQVVITNGHVSYIGH